MTNGKTPLYLTVLAMIVLATAVLLVQPYSVRSPWRAYTQPVRRYLRTALAGDSLTLLQQSVSPAPVAWALATARAHRDSVAVWAREANAWGGNRRADTSDVYLSLVDASCNMIVRFVGEGSHERVLGASSACWERR